MPKPTRAGRDILGAKSEPHYYTFDTDQLTLVTDKKHPLYDTRVELPVDETLVESILMFGVLDPIKVTRDASNGKLYVVDGRQRFKATVEANKRLKKRGAEVLRVPAIAKRGEDHFLVGIEIAQNFVRQAETPLSKARKIETYLNLGRTKEECAKVTGMSVTTIENLIGLLDATPELVAAVEKKEIAASTAYKLAKLKPDRQKEKVEKILKQAPRVPGKKRSPNAGKAKAIVEGTTRPRSAIEAMAKYVASLPSTPERQGAVATLDWVLGEDEDFIKKVAEVEGG